MAKFKFPNNSFFKGEVSPKFYSRTDSKEYFAACKELLNVIPTIQGGAGRRPGTQFIANTLGIEVAPSLYQPHTMTSGGVETKTSTNPKRIIPFVGPDKTYAIIIGVTDTANFDSGIIFNSTMWSVATTDANDFVNGVTTPVNSYPLLWLGKFGGVTLPNTSAFRGYTLAQLPEVQYAQNGDTMILTHPEVMPIIIKRNNTDYFTAAPYYCSEPRYLYFQSAPTFVDTTSLIYNINYTLDTTPVPFTLMPFLDQNTNTSHTMSCSAATVGTGRTLTSSQQFFSSSHVGAFFKITDSAVTGLVEVTAYTSTTSVTVRVIKALSGTGAYANWEESAWSDYRGWPRSVCFYQQRAYYGGNKQFPNTLWASRVGNYLWLDSKGYADGGSRTENISDANDVGTAVAIAYGTRTNIDPYNVKIASTEASVIQWMSPDKNVIIGTKEREWIGSGSDPAQTMGPFNINFSPETKNGSTFVQPIRFGNGLMFIQQDGQTVREFVFNNQEDAYRAENLSKDAEHIIRKSLTYYAVTKDPSIVRMAYQQLETGILWCLDSNGGLFACSRDRETNQIAWHPHKIGGLISSETAKVLDICVIPRTEFDSTNFSQGSPRHLSDLYLLIMRTVNSNTVVYLERMAPEFQAATINNTSTLINNKPIYCDAAKIKTLGALGTAFSGYDYLEGQTVECIADGSYVGTKTVSSGTITLNSNALQLIAGLSFRAIINPLYLEAGSIIGSAIGTLKKIDTIVFNFVRSVGAKFGKSTSTADLETIDMRDSGLAAGTATPLFSGQIEKEFRGGYEKTLSVAIVQDDPMPMYVSGFSARGETND